MTSTALTKDGEALSVTPYRVAGEDAPLWFSGALAGLGAVLAVGSSLIAFGVAPNPFLSQRPSAESARSLRMSQALPPLRPPTFEQAENAAKENRDVEARSEGRPAAVTPAAAPAAAPCLPIVSIAFPHNSAQPILDGAEARVKPLLTWLRDHPKAMLSVEGHADTQGKEAYNVVLSFARAQAIIAWLARSGLEKERMTSLAAGSALPMNSSLVVAENRMALVQVQGVAGCQSQGAETK